jgi:hypothetical protein
MAVWRALATKKPREEEADRDEGRHRVVLFFTKTSSR